MSDCYLAVDIGASSGRHMIMSFERGKLKLKEIYRFENGMSKKNGHLVWNTKKLFGEIVTGMRKCAEAGIIPVSMSIDTWAVDYALTDEEDKLVGSVYAYRDSRTEGMDQKVYEIISEDELYLRTGIQKQIFNTIYQLTADRINEPERLEAASAFLMLPDYFNYLLTGVKKSEYTNATSTGLVNPGTYDWDRQLIESLGLPQDIFLPLNMPGTTVGKLKKEIATKVGFNCEVVMCASHDTASAVMAVPAKETNSVYISSGTWSLIGTETDSAIINADSCKYNFTNEGGYDKRFRFLKNIMGLWMIQSVKKELTEDISYAEIAELAEEYGDIEARVDVNSQRFFAPKNMSTAIRQYCINSGQQVPFKLGQLAAVIYKSLAECYVETFEEIEKTTGVSHDVLYIVGGGSNVDFLNREIAKLLKKPVYAGPAEATAIGNALAQMIKAGRFKNLTEARECVYRSFAVKKYDYEGEKA